MICSILGTPEESLMERIPDGGVRIFVDSQRLVIISDVQNVVVQTTLAFHSHTGPYGMEARFP
jgi:hypothetical protein